MIAVFDLSQSYRSRDRLLPNRVISEMAKETLTKKGNLPKKERFFTLKGKCLEKRSLGLLEVTRRTGLRRDAHTTLGFTVQSHAAEPDSLETLYRCLLRA